jgi:hypothetical protein
MSTKTDNAAEVGLHVFEKAGLGKAPFRCIGYEQRTYQACPGAPIQVGGSCDYCGTGIIDTFILRGSDKKTFKVGSDCVMRTGDAGLIKAFKSHPEYRAAQKVKREAKDARVRAEVNALWADPANVAKFEAHMVEFTRGTEKYQKPFAAVMTSAWDFCGAAGRARYWKQAKAILAEASKV